MKTNQTKNSDVNIEVFDTEEEISEEILKDYDIGGFSFDKSSN